MTKAPCNCIVRRLPFYNELMEERKQKEREGNTRTYEELSEYCRKRGIEEDDVPVASQWSEHFNQHLARLPKKKGGLHPEELAKTIQKDIDILGEEIEEERMKGKDKNKRVIAQLINERRKLIEDQLTNQERYLEYQTDSPQELKEEMERILASGGMTKKTKERLMKALERSLGERIE